MSRGAEATRYRCFGIELESALALPGGWAPAPVSEDPVRLVAGEPDAGWNGGEPGWAGTVDGEPFVAEVAPDGAVRMTWGRALALLDPAVRELRLPSAALDSPASTRVLLDSVLFTAALALGGEALHAGCVTTPYGALAVCGPSGAGKSSLVRALLAAGARFHSDDVLFLRETEAEVLAEPGPPVMNLPLSAPLQDGEETLALFGDERWVSVAGTAAPAPLAGIVVLGEPGWASVLVHLMRFPATPERDAARFALAAALDAAVPVLTLPARERPPEAFANEALDWLRVAAAH